MEQSDIQVGKTYRSRREGHTVRSVLGIGPEFQPIWRGGPDKKPQPDAPGVLFMQGARRDWMYLSAFARWAESEVKVTTETARQPLIGIALVRGRLVTLRNDLSYLTGCLEADTAAMTQLQLAKKTLAEAMEALENVR